MRNPNLIVIGFSRIQWMLGVRHLLIYTLKIASLWRHDFFLTRNDRFINLTLFEGTDMPDAHSVFALPVDTQTALDQVADTAGRLGAVLVTRSDKQLVVRWPFIRALGSRTKAGAHVSIDVSAEAPGETQLSVSREYRDFFNNPADDSVRDVSGQRASQLVDAVREQWSGPDGALRVISRSAPPQRPAVWKLALAVLFFVGGSVAVWLIPAKSTQSGSVEMASPATTAPQTPPVQEISREELMAGDRAQQLAREIRKNMSPQFGCSQFADNIEQVADSTNLPLPQRINMISRMADNASKMGCL
jgi:hypothetical protein